MARQEIMADDYRPLPGQESTGGKKITLRDLIGLFSRNRDDNTPRGSRSEDYRNLPNGVNLAPQSFGLRYQPTAPGPIAERVYNPPQATQPESGDGMTTDRMNFGDAFRTYRDMMGPGAVFMWRGKLYTTDMATDTQAPAPTSTPAPVPTNTQAPVDTSATPLPLRRPVDTPTDIPARVQTPVTPQANTPVRVQAPVDTLRSMPTPVDTLRSMPLRVPVPIDTTMAMPPVTNSQPTPQRPTVTADTLLNQAADTTISDILWLNRMAGAAQPDSMTYATGPVVSHIPIQDMADPSSPFTRRYQIRGGGPERQLYRFTGEQPRPIPAAETLDDPYINPYTSFPYQNWYDFLDQEARRKYQLSLQGRDAVSRPRYQQSRTMTTGPTHTSSY